MCSRMGCPKGLLVRSRPSGVPRVQTLPGGRTDGYGGDWARGRRRERRTDLDDGPFPTTVIRTGTSTSGRVRGFALMGVVVEVRPGRRKGDRGEVDTDSRVEPFPYRTGSPLTGPAR